MDISTPVKHHGKSKLEQFSLDFEVNRSLSDERKITKKRTDRAR